MNKDNWNTEMKYLMPSLAQFLIAIMSKHPQFFAVNYEQQIREVILRTLSNEIRMEDVGLSLAATFIERIKPFDDEFTKKLFYSIFQALSFY